VLVLCIPVSFDIEPDIDDIVEDIEEGEEAFIESDMDDREDIFSIIFGNIPYAPP
jgi:hypothetical protein